MARLAAAIALILTILTGSTRAADPKEILVFIRVDDLFSVRSEIKPQEMDAFLKVLEKHGAHAVLSTIPMRFLQKTNADGLMTDQIRDYVRRGHQIAQHGMDHRCPFSGRNDHEFYTPDVKGYSRDEKLRIIAEGHKIVEAAAGRKVITYVGPGSDGTYMAEDVPEFLKMGFITRPDLDEPTTAAKVGCALLMAGDDYTWAITEETYKQRMDDAKASFLANAAVSNMWSVKYHDPFTRAAYANAITMRWTEEFLTWLEAQPGYRIKYVTFEEHYRASHPEFSPQFDKD